MRSTSNARQGHHCATEQVFNKIACQGLLSSLSSAKETQLTHGFLANGIYEVSIGVKKFLEVGGEELQVNSQPLVDIRSAIWHLEPGNSLKVNFPRDISLKRDQLLECPWVEVTCFSANNFFVTFGNGSSESYLRDALESFPVFNLAKLDLEINLIPRHPGVKSFSESFAVTLLKDSLNQNSIPAYMDLNGNLCFTLDSSLFKASAAIRFWSTCNVLKKRTEDGLFLIAPDLSAYHPPPETFSVTITHEPNQGTDKQLFKDETLNRASRMIQSFLIENFGCDSKARIESIQSLC